MNLAFLAPQYALEDLWASLQYVTLVIEDTYWRLYWCDPGVGGYLLIQLKVYSCGNDEELDKMVNKDVIKKMDNEMDDGVVWIYIDT